MTRIETLGHPHASLPHRNLGPGKAVALLTFLSAAPNRSALRREVFALLYSENSPRDTDAFRQLLVSLRKTLPDIFVASNDLVSLAEPLESDRQQLLDACNRGDDEAALALYQHEFFDPFDEPGCEGFLRWAHEERVRLRRRFEQAAEALVRKHLSRADWTAALAVSSDVAERFPGLHVSLRLLTEVLTLSGRGDELRAILSELGVPRQQGTPAQRRALDRLLDDVDTLARTGALTSPTRPLIARTREFRAVLETWSAVRTGAGSAMLIDGHAGLGKTRLLSNLALRLRLDTPAVIRLGAAADDRAAPLTMLRQLAAAIMALPGALGATPQHYVALQTLADDATAVTIEDETDDGHLARLTDAFADGLRAIGEESAVAILIDDLDRANQTTRRVITAVAARLRTARVLLIISSREPLGQAIDVSSRHRLTLGPLDRDAAAQLYACATGTTDKHPADAFHDGTDGVPACMIAALNAADAQAQATRSAQHATTTTTTPSNGGTDTGGVLTIPRRRVTRLIPVGAIAAAGVMLTTLAIQKARAFVPPESFTVLTWHGDSLTREAFTIGDTDSAAVTPQFDEHAATTPWRQARIPERVSIAPDGHTLAVQTETDLQNTTDVIGILGDSIFDIATGPRDDAMPDWSPDGSLIAFSTNRWADAGNEGCDIAVRDMHAGEIWRVTDGFDCDVSPRWTGDGRGVGFLRRFRERIDSTAVCATSLGREPAHCTVIDSTLHDVGLLDWRNDDEVLLSASHDNVFAIYAMHLRSGRSRLLIDDLNLMEAELSPSRRYLACWCSTSRDTAQRITLFDLSGKRPLLSRSAPISAHYRHIGWNIVGIVPFADSLQRRATLRALHSASMASAAITTARLKRQQTGPTDTLVHARAMMQRAVPELARAVSRLPFPAFSGVDNDVPRAATDSLVIDETWRDIDSVRWRGFGDPRPRASTTLGGLHPGGDGSYPSGLYTRRAITAPRGLELEAAISVPITLPYWQSVNLELVPEQLVSGMQTWNHTTGTWNTAQTPRRYQTAFQYPVLESPTRAMSFNLGGGGTSERYIVSPAMGDGRDVALRMTLGVDSLVTVFINGQQYAQRRYLPTPTGRYHLMITGHSVETAVRVRRLRVWRR